jgi:hypothetical protein
MSTPRTIDARLLDRAEKTQRSVAAFIEHARRTAVSFQSSVSDGLIRSSAETEAKRIVEGGHGAIALSVADLTPGMSRLGDQISEQYSTLKGELEKQVTTLTIIIEDLEEEADNIEHRQLPGLDFSKSNALADADHKFETGTTYVQNRDEYTAERDRFERLRMYNKNSFPRLLNPFLYWTTLFAIGIGDMVVNYNVFLAKFELLIAILLTAIVGYIVAVTSHVHGKYFKQRKLLFTLDVDAIDRSHIRRELVIVTGFFIACLVFIFWARYSYFAQGAGLDLSSDGLLSIQFIASRVAPTIFFNLIVWFVGALVSFFAHERVPELRETFIKWKKLDAELDVMKGQLAKQKDEIERTYDAEKLAFEGRLAECKSKLVNLNSLRDQCTKLKQNYEGQLASQFSKIMKQYVGTFCARVQALEKDTSAVTFISPRRGKLSMPEFEASEFRFMG